MKKLAKWIFISLLLPLLKDLLKDIMKSSFKYMLDLIKQKMSKWKTQDESNAKTDEEKEIVRNKWEQRMQDVESMKATMDQSIEKIIDAEIKKSEQKVEAIEIKQSNVKQISIN
jgi:hypothetical protein